MAETPNHIEIRNGTVPVRRMFVVTEQMCLNETRCPMQPGQTGFAYPLVCGPVQIEIDNIPYTVDRKHFLASTKWCTA